MSLLAIAYPDLSKSDEDFIQNFRKEHDKFYEMVQPHFALVFPLIDFSAADFTTEIKNQMRDVKPINFSIRCTTVNKDAFSELYHVFLVPDEGFSGIVKLHDKLYNDKLIENRRLDIDYIPHIGIGNSNDKWLCKKLADEWNQ